MGWLNKEDKEEASQNPNTDEEKKLVSEIETDKIDSQTGVREDAEDNWSDEYLCLKGSQWDTSIAPRSAKLKTERPNVVLNVTLPTIMNIVDALTASTPTADITGREANDKEVALKLRDLIDFIFERNIFDKQWYDIVRQGVAYGPFIGYVPWDPDFIGGSGPSRFIGEVRTFCQKKNEIFFDPAIHDLEEHLQECRFIQQRVRKNLSWIRDKWDNGKYVSEDVIEDDENLKETEGVNPKRVTLISHWHRGTPKYISAKDKKKYEEKAEELREKGNEFKAKEYDDMASGKLKGIHCAYVANGVFLEYIPYVYEDGLYPFVYAVLYQDEYNPYGYGEIRNIINPQIMYNKVAEIEMEAAAIEGLGGYFYNKGSLGKAQLDDILSNGHRGGAWHEVLNKDGIDKKEGTQTPQSLVQFKDFLKEGIDTISQNTAIMQGVSPGANVPYSSIRELGNRADVRSKGKMNILERFMTQFIRLMISRISQFYTDEREYRIRGSKSQAIKTALYNGIQNIIDMNNPKQELAGMVQLLETFKNADPNSSDDYGKFSNEELKRTWNRRDDDGVEKEEEYMADFDIRVKIADERPTSRQYYEQIAMNMYGRGMGPSAFWKTIDEGKFPSTDEILDELKELQQRQAQGAAPENIGPQAAGSPQPPNM